MFKAGDWAWNANTLSDGFIKDDRGPDAADKVTLEEIMGGKSRTSFKLFQDVSGKLGLNERHKHSDDKDDFRPYIGFGAIIFQEDTYYISIFNFEHDGEDKFKIIDAKRDGIYHLYQIDFWIPPEYNLETGKFDYKDGLLGRKRVIININPREFSNSETKTKRK